MLSVTIFIVRLMANAMLSALMVHAIILWDVMLNAIMPSVIILWNGTLNIILLSVVRLNAIVQSVVMLNATMLTVMLNARLLSVMAPSLSLSPGYSHSHTLAIIWQKIVPFFPTFLLPPHCVHQTQEGVDLLNVAAVSTYFWRKTSHVKHSNVTDPFIDNKILFFKWDEWDNNSRSTSRLDRDFFFFLQKSFFSLLLSRVRCKQ